MSLSPMPIRPEGWRGAGCGTDCLPRSHDPIAHEQWGYQQALEAVRPKIVRTGALTINLPTGRAWVGSREIVLSRLEWEILAYLAERPGENIPSTQIGTAIWGDEAGRAFALPCASQTFYRLRAKLGSAAHLLVTRQTGRSAYRRLEMVEPEVVS